ncbi:MAG: hypothetical protein HY866_01350 [Chloroflexi bacterium]|nr:hypothetical protein [Chloroflexota bacterium]
MPLDCGHQPDLQSIRVCRHIWENNTNVDFAFIFTEDELEHRICSACARKPAEIQTQLRTICAQCLDALEFRGLEDIERRPGIRERQNDLIFVHQEIQLKPGILTDSCAVQPIPGSSSALWLAVTVGGQVVRIDLTERYISILFRVQPTELPLTDKVLLALSPDAAYIAIANKLGSTGIIIQTADGQPTMKLDRGNYYPEQTPFPVAFVVLNNELYVIHGTNGNRLDISDPKTGRLLTERSPTSYRQGEPRPAHYLDYFHGQLIVSPNNEWAAEYGWVWHPIGHVRCWNLPQWLNGNVWESEDGPSLKRFADAACFWNGPLCWVGDHRLAVWGIGDDEEDMIPAVRIFDVVHGNRERWFYGPEQGLLVFDRYLFSGSEQGMSVWDAATGERLLHDPTLNPISYHRDTKRFLSILPDGTCRLSHLIDRGLG